MLQWFYIDKQMSLDITWDVLGPVLILEVSNKSKLMFYGFKILC